MYYNVNFLRPRAAYHLFLQLRPLNIRSKAYINNSSIKQLLIGCHANYLNCWVYILANYYGLNRVPRKRYGEVPARRTLEGNIIWK